MAGLYRIHWEDKQTGQKGRGELIDGKKHAARIALELNINYPTFNHYIKETPENE